MWKPIYFVPVLVISAWTASLVPCPEHCICQTTDGKLHADCPDFGVLRKLQPKQVRCLETLTIVNRSLVHIDPKIKVLRYLKNLDLSYNLISNLEQLPSSLSNLVLLNVSFNKIKSFSAHTLPQNLVHLDVSSNLISDLSQKLMLLPYLQTFNITGNPVSCKCSVLEVRDALKHSQVTIAEPVVCAEPPELYGKSWNDEETCGNVSSIWEQMLGDEPFNEGSGSGDAADTLNIEDPGVFEGEIEQEYIPESHHGKSNHEGADVEADYEGSGAEIEKNFLDNHPKPCYINCSTPPPIEDHNGTTATPVGGLDGLRMVFEDIAGTDPQEVTEYPLQKETITYVKEIPISGQPFNEETKDSEVEVFDNRTTLVKDRAVSAKISNSTYVLLAVSTLVIIMIVVFAIVKTRNHRKNKNRRHGIEENDIGKKSQQEMTEFPLLRKLPLEEKTNNISEKVPLMNGQNGSQNGKPVEEPVTVDENVNSDTQAAPTDDNEYVELRMKKDHDALLTPETKRVTIKAGEIPGSVPRTPLLVNRHISSDGNVITTPSVEQRMN